MNYTNIRTVQGGNTIDSSYVVNCADCKDYDPEFEKLHIWDQLGKILDSLGNKFPRDDVTCDDGTKITGITAKDCISIRNLALQFEKTEDRKQFFDRIQKSNTNFMEILEYVRAQ